MLVDDFAEVASIRLQRRGSGLDLDSLLHLADLQLDVGASARVDGNRNDGNLGLAEARLFDGYIVEAGRQQREAEPAIRSRYKRLRQAGGRVP